MKALAAYRQSLLRSFEVCPRRTLASLQTPDDLSVGYVEASADLGRMVHEVIAEILRTLRRQGEKQMPTEEAIVVMREVYAASPITLPSKERDDLRWMVLTFCNYRFDPKLILAIERPLSAGLKCPDGKIRTLTGIPDLLLRDGFGGLVIVDLKSGLAKPRSPRVMPEEGQPIKGKQYLSDRGHYQLDAYGLLSMLEYPQAKYAILRELHLRSGEIREAVLTREELEHVAYELGAHMQKLERAIEEGEDSPAWRPRPGRQCLKACPVSKSCPIPAEQRGLGSLATPALADEAAARFVVMDGVRDQLRNQLKAYHEEEDAIPLVGDGSGLFWRKNEMGKRAFGVWPLESVGERELVISHSGLPSRMNCRRLIAMSDLHDKERETAEDRDARYAKTLWDLRERLLPIFVGMDEGDAAEPDLLGARYYLERAVAKLQGNDPDTVIPERPEEWQFPIGDVG